MKRFLILFMVLGLIVGSVATAGAQGKKRPTRLERTVVGSYGPYPAPVTGCNGVLDTFACLIVETHPTEAFFTAKVTDTHGQPVPVAVAGSFPGGRFVEAFCGETTEPIRFSPGAQLEFYVAEPHWRLTDPALDCQALAVKSIGTISVTLSNLP